MTSSHAGGGPSRPAFGAARLAEDTRERFLRDVGTRVPVERMVELFLFAPIRQGGVETGVAVLAVRREVPAPPDDAPPTEPPAVEAADAPVDALTAPVADEAAAPGVPTRATTPRERHAVLVARYRLTVKGPERGKWLVEVRDEADAPLVTVEEVVRGVQRRVGDASEPVRFDAAAIAGLLATPGVRPPFGGTQG
jgi:hypothetical protein